MKIQSNNFLLFIFLINISTFIHAQHEKRNTYEINLETSDWFYRKKGDINKFVINSRWPEMYMGTIHVLNPMKEFNADSLRWIENAEWEYFTTLKSNGYNYKHYVLAAENIEPWSEIFVEENKAGESTNYFIKYFFDLTGKIKADKSTTITVKIPSCVKKANEIYASSKIIYPSDADESKTSQFIRKPACQFGWDISPRLLIPHLSTNMKLIGWNDFFIYNHYIKQESVTEKEARLSVYFDIESDTAQKVNIRYSNHGTFTTVTKELKKGKQTIQLLVIIKNPKLWWPNGLYQQYSTNEILKKPELYDLVFEFESAHQKEKKSIRTGIKTIELVRKKDKEGESFFFKINQKPVFIKGANLVPVSNYLFSTSDYFLKSLEHNKFSTGNMNMIRIWGGGEYLSDKFYNYCDENGIMIWQDFMFANTMYPSDISFLQNVKEEAEHQVKRLSHHPCIALWCGNNEIEVAWKNWSWQAKYKYTDLQIKELENGYDQIFRHVLPLAVKEFSNNTGYLSSSPVSNWGRPEDFSSGDNHYWGVWHGEHQIKMFKSRIPRFMSEYGLPSFPGLETVKYFFEKDFNKWSVDSLSFKYRMRSYKGIKLMEEYIYYEYGRPKNIYALIILSQILQSNAYKTAIEAHRRAKPYCMGTMYWQLNDAWPGITWSAIDYNGIPKPAYYEINNSYQPLIISATEENDTISVYVISDYVNDTTVNIEIKLMDFYGKKIKELKKEILIPADTSVITVSFPVETFIGKHKRNKILLYSKVYKKEQKYPFAGIHDNIYYFDKFSELELPKVPETSSFDGNYTFTSSVLMKNINHRYYNDRNKRISMYEDILPGDKVTLFENEDIMPDVVFTLTDLIQKDSTKK